VKTTLFFVGLLVFLFGVLAFRADDPTSVEELGERLFFDPILSLDSSIRCGSCHLPDFAFADTLPFSKGVGGRLGKRNTQSITNMSARAHYFYDGRAATLEQQIMMPVLDTLEMRASAALIETRLRRHSGYQRWFQTLYHSDPSVGLLAAAIAAYIRTLETSDTPFDRYMQDKPGGMSDDAVKGREIFMQKGKCFDCHFSPDFTGDEFRNIGLYNEKNFNDKGRFGQTLNPQDLGKFKVPGLRNVAVTAPYMHNGQFKTLREVIDYYDNPDAFVPNSINRDSLLARPLGLSEEEKSQLLAFLHALTDDRYNRQKKAPQR
jgi:cytochrome c peroxidase